MQPVKTALVSVYDKSGILEFAKGLNRLGIQIISTGGTAALLKKSGLKVREVSSVTQFPEILGGRVKTLHPKLYGGILAKRSDRTHLREIKAKKISFIDLVVVNLYPFASVASDRKASEDQVIEMIDIGGPALLRAAAKNFKDVGVVCDKSQYKKVLKELNENKRVLSDATRREFSSAAFKTVSAYDESIFQYFRSKSVQARSKPAQSLFPDSVEWAYDKVSDLRYGENPHQKAAMYKRRGEVPGIVSARQLHGKELSFNNYLDLDAALKITSSFQEPCAAVVKHTSPCGVALGTDVRKAFLDAFACDPLSAFGGIVGLNREVNGALARVILNSGFLECIIAPHFSKEALSVLSKRKNLRLIQMQLLQRNASLDFKRVSGGVLIQQEDKNEIHSSTLKVVTRKSPLPDQITDLLFAFKACRFVKSNAIVVVKDRRTIGIGMGQPSRVDSCQSALKKAGRSARGAVLASDGFFPKPDSITLAKRYGIRAIIQPGGSIQDPAVIVACDRARIAMLLTGVRHFTH